MPCRIKFTIAKSEFGKVCCSLQCCFLQETFDVFGDEVSLSLFFALQTGDSPCFADRERNMRRAMESVISRRSQRD